MGGWLSNMFSLMLLVALLGGCATHFGQGWSREDTLRQAAVTGLIYYDLQVQTPKYLDEGREMNPFISKSNLDAYTIGAMSAHALASASLKPKYRKMWQLLIILTQGLVITHNFTVD